MNKIEFNSVIEFEHYCQENALACVDDHKMGYVNAYKDNVLVGRYDFNKTEGWITL